MHRSLRIPEIVELIFIEIRVPPGALAEDAPDHARDRPTLAALARTCTAFLDPALNLLWEHQHTISNFLGCFPRDLFDQVVPRYGSTTNLVSPRSLLDLVTLKYIDV